MTAHVLSLAPILAGPILRRVNPHEFSLWMASSVEPTRLIISLQHGDTTENFAISYEQSYQLSPKLWIILAHFKPDFAFDSQNLATDAHHLKLDKTARYDIFIDEVNNSILPTDLSYSEGRGIDFNVSDRADHILHGSCRNPHHHSGDSLLAIDAQLQKGIHHRPDMLLLNGDQIYADHVAGPMLDAIHQVIELLDLPDEDFTKGPVADSQALYLHPKTLYRRDDLLPKARPQQARFNTSDIPIFSSTDAHNHLVTFSEFIAMYLLVWSPELWTHINIDRLEDAQFIVNGENLSLHFQKEWHEEKAQINQFVEGLSQVRRVLAHIPTYMIFDDHDITDDWNLTVGWEKAAYEHPFSKQIIGNGLLSYLLCQAWGNDPSIYHTDWHRTLTNLFKPGEPPAQFDKQILDETIYDLLRYERWHFSINSTPKVVVLDTRTRRWRSESNLNKPSGLMDWEALVEFQHELIDQDSVIVVSAAPMFGVKFIETMQRLATIAGKPLMIDAENWMAHPGSANTLLSIFTHSKTPKNFVILSGDVHYSFVYDIALRYRETDSHIYQITCSGIKNEFPAVLLNLFGKLDAWLYTPRSPLNWFTKRKQLKIFKRHPSPPASNHLVNRSGIGRLKLDSDGKPSEICVIHSDGTETHFPEINDHS
ncbi:alkaline phosphatase family protein [Vibrio sp. E150_011]